MCLLILLFRTDCFVVQATSLDAVGGILTQIWTKMVGFGLLLVTLHCHYIYHLFTWYWSLNSGPPNC
jgi:hypothetical protein